MKILELDFLAFGPFEGVSLDLSGGDRGLHLVYGDNEAGKSSALRGLLGLLYGIPADTPDAHRHEPSALRIGARLQRSDGTVLAIIRRKGRRGTLLDREEQTLEDTVLEPLLGGVGVEQFRTMFGIDHLRLLEGGRALLEGKGSVGRSLYAAGLGWTRLERALAAIDEESAELFRPRAVHPRINSALKRWGEALERAKERSLQPDVWREHDQELARAIEERARLAAERSALAARRAELESILADLPRSKARSSLTAELESLSARGGVPPQLLAPDAPEQRRAAQRSLALALAAEQRAAAEIETVEPALAALEIPSELLALEEPIRVAEERLYAFRRAAEELPKRKTQLDRLDAEIDRLLRGLWPGARREDLEARRPSRVLRARVEELGKKHAELLANRDRLRELAAALRGDLDRVVSELRVLPSERDVGPLKKAIREAEREGDLDQRQSELEATVTGLQERARAQLGELGLWSGDLESIEQLLRPPVEAIERFDQDLDRARSELERAIERKRELAARAQELEQQLAALLEGAALPSESELDAARAERGAALEKIRRVWIEKQKTKEPHAEIFGALERSIAAADEVSDRLQREAERVAKRSSIETEQRAVSDQSGAVEAARLAAEAAVADVEERWRRAWQVAGITPAAPREMLAWVRRQESLATTVRSLREARRERGRAEERARLHKKKLESARAALGSTGATKGGLAAAIELCTRFAESIEELNQKRRGLDESRAALDQKLDGLGSRLGQINDALGDWRASWTEVALELGLKAEASPAEVGALLEGAEELFRRVDERAALARAVEALETDKKELETKAAALVNALKQDPRAAPPDQLVTSLGARLRKANVDAATQAQLVQRKQALAGDLEAARARAREARASLDVLVAAARVASIGALEEAERRSARRRELEAAIAAIDAELGRSGQSAVERARGLEALDAEETKRELELAIARHERLEAEISALDQELGKLRALLGAMDGRDDAALLADEAQALGAEARRGVERYVRLRLAAGILRRHIERYRRQNEGPLLQRAGRLFQRMTAGAFERLEVRLDANDRPVLLAGRPVAGGEAIGVEAMSEGTRDQLYLALRLASLERHLEAPGQEPLPLIADDILLNFDDGRAAATLAVLGELAEKTQVLLFTHHRRILDLAREAVPASQLFVHELGRSGREAALSARNAL